jgi:hypothetical protein
MPWLEYLGSIPRHGPERRKAKKVEITLQNKFHNTETTIRPKLTEKGNFCITKRTLKKVRNELCIQEDCCCGDFFHSDAFTIRFSRNLSTGSSIEVVSDHEEGCEFYIIF